MLKYDTYTNMFVYINILTYYNVKFSLSASLFVSRDTIFNFQYPIRFRPKKRQNKVHRKHYPYQCHFTPIQKTNRPA